MVLNINLLFLLVNLSHLSNTTIQKFRCGKIFFSSVRSKERHLFILINVSSLLNKSNNLKKKSY